MLRATDRSRPVEVRRAHGTSSFDRWLEQVRRRGAGTSNSGTECGSHVNGHGGGHVEPRSIGRTSLRHHRSHAALPWLPAPSSFSLPGQHSRLEELEELLLSEGYSNHLPSPSAVREGMGCNPSCALQVASRSRPLDMLPSGAALPYPHGGIADSLYSAVDGADQSGGRHRLNEPYDFTPEFMSRCALPSGGVNPRDLIISAAEAEAERYIARLEKEVQTLMIEICDKDLCIVAVSAAKDAMALQVQEQQKRGELMRDEGTTRLMLSHNFMRTLMFFRTQDASNRAMELNTQIALLKHELKLAEALLAQSQNSATATVSQQQQQQPLQTKKQEEELAHAVSKTLRSLLQDEYDRLAQLVSEMPNKMQMIMSTSCSLSNGEEDDAARDAAATQQRQLYELLQSVLGSLGGASSSLMGTASPAASASVITPSPKTPALMDADSSHLVRLVSRVCRHQEAMTDLYCTAVDQKAALAQYEGDIVRLISAKQRALTWATLYEDKKDEVKHLHEAIMSLRGDLRAAKEQGQRFVGSRPSAGRAVSSTISKQSYETYAAPYVPSTAQLSRPSRNKLEGPSTSIQIKSRPVAAIIRPIGELREEARRLGALPASYYPPLVTSPSPSMSSLSASSSPANAQQTLLTHEHQDVARGKLDTHVQLAGVPTVAQVPAVGAGSSLTCSVVASVFRASPRPRESAGASSPSLRIRTDIAPRSAAQPQLHTRARDSSQRTEAATERSIPRRVVSRSLSSSSSASEVLHAARSLKVATLKRVFGVTGTEGSGSASSPSTSSVSLLSHTKAQWTAPTPTAAAAKQQSEAKASHNSFDDTESDASDAGAVKARKGPLKVSQRLSSSKLTVTGMSAKPVFSGKTFSSAAAAATLISDSKKQIGPVGLDEGTSSASLSMLSPPSVPLKAAPGGSSTSAHNTEKKGPCLATTLPHLRKSSFDEDDNTSSRADSSSSSSSDSTPLTLIRATRTKLGSNTARTFTAAAPPSAARRPLSAIITVPAAAGLREEKSTP
ncbi:hypothetical protein GH5_04786 [Leishmania sp. Ghana 2012 LV757]|uniref:hypothetical protein n=1 Tax=Leishmania sp. Ghana 2012 LV757 TaxID=2803181 RepID=UPI001B5F3C3A|nr:hypothetical protein GH5_04786 [Leishmania sp. Ghana 2012 LV757]